MDALNVDAIMPKEVMDMTALPAHGNLFEPSGSVLLDRASRGQRPVSTAPLFSIPMEMLNMIMAQVEVETVEVLALINSDFRQLARSGQFVDFKFDGSHRRKTMLQTMCEQADDGAKRDSGSVIGDCVRLIQVDTVQTEAREWERWPDDEESDRPSGRAPYQS